MRARRALGFFQTILMTVTGVSAACGGTMVVDEEGSTTDAGGDAYDHRDAGRTQDDVDARWDETDGSNGGSSSGGSSSGGSSSGGSSSGGSSSGGGVCSTGTVAFDPSFCCDEDGGVDCTGGGGGPSACILDCTKVCDDVAPSPGPSVMQYCTYTQGTSVYYMCGSCGVGRVPSGTAPCPEGESVGERLAHQAYYEAVSVGAFERLAAVLDASGASDLAVRARQFAEDEARHAAIFTALARARGATVRVPEPSAHRPTLLELAVENAAEGCVRETYGALVTLHQAAHAEDEDVRAAFAAIAADEAEHAAFSWELSAWFEARLTHAEVVSMHAARDAARAALRPSIGDTPLARALGMPSPSLACALFDRVLAEAPSLAA